MVVEANGEVALLTEYAFELYMEDLGVPAEILRSAIRHGSGMRLIFSTSRVLESAAKAVSRSFRFIA